jgi:hypothetical protein
MFTFLGAIGLFFLVIMLITKSEESPSETQERESNELVDSMSEMEQDQLAGKNIK